MASAHLFHAIAIPGLPTRAAFVPSYPANCCAMAPRERRVHKLEAHMLHPLGVPRQTSAKKAQNLNPKVLEKTGPGSKTPRPVFFHPLGRG